METKKTIAMFVFTICCLMTAAATDHVVISEVQFNAQGTIELGKEWVELYNPTASPITIGGYTLWKESKTLYGVKGNQIGVIPNGATIAPYSYYLIGDDGELPAGMPTPDTIQEVSTFVNGGDGFIIKDPQGGVIDAVGWLNVVTQGYFEGTPIGPNSTVSGDMGYSVERKLGGSCGNAIDTGNNSADFFYQKTINPQNSASPAEIPCAVDCVTDDDCNALDGACTHGVCGSNNECVTVAANPGTSCNDGLFCTVNDACSAGVCTGSPKDCSANSLQQVATCANTPDANPLTWDFAAAFTSICNEATDSCSTGSQTLTHTCDITVCGAECVTTANCAPTDCDFKDGCVGRAYYDYNDIPNTCSQACGCSDNLCQSPAIYADDARCTNDCTTNADCDDGLYCNGQETCNTQTKVCVSGSTINCHANDIAGIATCASNPDSNPLTWDYRLAFASTCDEATDICTTGASALTHACDMTTCHAECDSNDNCQPTDCDTLDGCVGKEYRDYQDFQSLCQDCSCTDGSCITFTSSQNDSRCINSCLVDEDCMDVCGVLDGCFDGRYRDYTAIATSCDNKICLAQDCDPAVNNYTLAGADGDADGFDSLCECDDSDASIFPGQQEICDGIDNNCDTKNDEGFPDFDMDNQADCVDADDDNDSLPDSIEIDDPDGATTDPKNPDSDNDGIMDGVEDRNKDGKVDADETDPNMADTDGDTIGDAIDELPLDPSDWLDTDRDGIGDLTDTDKDGDGIENAKDALNGNSSHVQGSSGLLFSVGGVSNPASPEGLSNVTITKDGNDLVRFRYNFSNSTSLDLRNVRIEVSDDNSSGAIAISGITLQEGMTKEIILKNTVGKNTICIKDAEGAVISSISALCNGADEYPISCPGTNSGYSCGYADSTNTSIAVFGLKHSAVNQQAFCGDGVCSSNEACQSCQKDCGQCPKPPTTSGSTRRSSGGGGGGYIAPRIPVKNIKNSTNTTLIPNDDSTLIEEIPEVSETGTSASVEEVVVSPPISPPKTEDTVNSTEGMEKTTGSYLGSLMEDRKGGFGLLIILLGAIALGLWYSGKSAKESEENQSIKPAQKSVRKNIRRAKK